jgi:LPS O-antigen subunit length determinant protein (WzzB/FepE family)
MRKPAKKKDPFAIDLLTTARDTLAQYVAHVTNKRIPNNVNYRRREGQAALREVRGLLKEEQDGWID